MKKVFIVAAKRTAIGSFGGALVGVSARSMGSTCARAAFSGLSEKVTAGVDEVIVGNVLAAGHGMNIARQIALDSGLKSEVPAFTVNQVCGSGLKAIALGFQSIRAGDAQCVLAGGVESMSQAMHVSSDVRWGKKMGAVEFKDLMLSDGLTDAFHGYHMGITAENLATEFKISREEQDAYAAESQRRAGIAQQAGHFKNEIAAVPLLKRGAVVGSFDTDEYIRPQTSTADLKKLSPAFQKDGTVTAGNASGINDGAAMLVLMSEEALARSGATALAEVLAVSAAGVAPERMGYGPVPAARKACESAKLTVGDLELVEANEAFAVQALVVQRELGLDPLKVNVSGGAIALGHPIGASGARVLTTLIYGLQRSSKQIGLATLCIGGGQGIAMIIRRAA